MFNDTAFLLLLCFLHIVRVFCLYLAAEENDGHFFRRSLVFHNFLCVGFATANARFSVRVRAGQSKESRLTAALVASSAAPLQLSPSGAQYPEQQRKWPMFIWAFRQSHNKEMGL
jgi:hypothetical protein